MDLAAVKEQEWLFRMRQQDIAPLEKLSQTPVCVIGSGGIGSNCCFQGAKLGLKLTVYDGDDVSPENINNQIFSVNQIGMKKVEAVRNLCREHAGMEIQAVPEFVRGGEPVSGIVIEALDSMKARREVWQKVILPRAPLIRTYFSARMGAESGMLVRVDPSQSRDRIWYEMNELYSDDEAVPLPCTGRATSYCANLIAALAIHQVKQILTGGQTYRRIEFSLEDFTFLIDEG